MPYKRPGTWEGKPHFRWVKMVKGQRVRIRCADDLHLPPDLWTEMGSIKAASEFLEKKLAELCPEPPKAVDTVLAGIDGLNADDLFRIVEQGRMAGRLLNAAQQAVANEVEQLPDGSFTAPIDHEQRGLDRLRQEMPSAILDELLSGREGRLPMREDWRKIMADDFVSRLANKSKVASVGNLEQTGREFLAVLVGKLRPKSYREIKEVIDGLPSLADGQGQIVPAEVGQINERTVERVYLALRATTLSQGKKKKKFGIFQRFVVRCVEMNLLEMPRNLHSRLLKFKVSPKAIKTFTNDQVKEAIDSLPSRLQLYAMLALNCGMNNVDIGQLEKSQVKNGYLTRKRVKTSEAEDVPTVSYKLWPTTLALLKKHESDHATLMLTSMDGTPLWTARIEDGKSREKDLVGQQWQRHKAKCKIQLKQFRSIGSTALEDHTEYGRYGSLFLGHSPKSIKDKHYAAPSQKTFDKAIVWLGKQYGF